MVGHDTLDVGILVRIQVKQPSKKSPVHIVHGAFVMLAHRMRTKVRSG